MKSFAEFQPCMAEIKLKPFISGDMHQGPLKAGRRLLAAFKRLRSKPCRRTNSFRTRMSKNRVPHAAAAAWGY